MVCSSAKDKVYILAGDPFVCKVLHQLLEAIYLHQLQVS